MHETNPRIDKLMMTVVGFINQSQRSMSSVNISMILREVLSLRPEVLYNKMHTCRREIVVVHHITQSHALRTQ